MEVLSSRMILRVSDFARSRDFYEDVLGLHPYREYGDNGVVTGVVYFAGGGYLELTANGEVSPGSVIIWLQVRDIKVEESRLIAAGARVRKPAERMPWGLIEMWIEDPDGVEVRLVEVPEDHPLRRRTRIH
jgi:predicted enzyme related to lactoylglutathione lyase